MKKSTLSVMLTLAVLIVGAVCYYGYLSRKSRDAAADSEMTEVQRVLSRDLQNDYPPTVKEVMKYYVEIEKCLYSGDCGDEDIKQLGLRARELYDAELLANNAEEANLQQLRAEVAAFQSDKKKMTSASVSSSVNVETFSQDGFDFARIQCHYTILENGKSNQSAMVYLLRRDEGRRWKIYGWELAQNVAPK